jgi:WhiB family transcriptional regulator, redox-sensing transcriptional regulator
MTTYLAEDPTAELLLDSLITPDKPAVPTDDVAIAAFESALLESAPVLDASIDPAYGVQLAGLPCQELDADLWFAETPAELETAKAHCAGCPLRTGCLAGALERREPWGVWGGEIFDHGVIVARKRPRGRPRKNAAEVAA